MTNLELLTMPLLLERSIADAESSVKYTHNDYKSHAETRLAELRARWEREAPARALRAELERLGFRRSEYNPGMWVRRHKVTGRWLKFTPEAALCEAGLPVGDPNADATSIRFSLLELK